MIKSLPNCLSVYEVLTSDQCKKKRKEKLVSNLDEAEDETDIRSIWIR